MHRHTTFALNTGVKLCAGEVTCAGQSFVPDEFSAFVKFSLAHVFPVTTSDHTALLPQVVANSFPTMRFKLLDLAHMVKGYGTSQRDFALGTVLASEFPAAPSGGWKVQGDRAAAPGMTCVGVVHKQLEGVPDILATWERGEIAWTVSMEQRYRVDEIGFGVLGRKGVEEFEERTPEDLRALGWTYVPFTAAPTGLLLKYDQEQSSMQAFQGQDTLAFFGGIDGKVQFYGTGLCMLGKEPEACVQQMMASGLPFVLDERSGVLHPDVLHPLRQFLNQFTG